MHLLVVCIKTYEKQIFLVLSHENIESIENSCELTIKRCDFLRPTCRKKLVEFLMKNYYDNTYLAIASAKLKKPN